jgi:hypothetical protein
VDPHGAAAHPRDEAAQRLHAAVDDAANRRGITRTRWPGCDLERLYNRTIGHEWPKLGPYKHSVGGLALREPLRRK